MAQAQVAYQHFHAAFSGDRAGRRCAAKGARVQRPLWASTSTKNPAYSDLLYVDTLIGPATVNTMPDGTIAAFEDHGTVHRTVDADPQAADDRAGQVWPRPASTWPTSSRPSRTKASHSFAKSFDELLQSLSDKAATF